MVAPSAAVGFASELTRGEASERASWPQTPTSLAPRFPDQRSLCRAGWVRALGGVPPPNCFTNTPPWWTLARVARYDTL